MSEFSGGAPKLGFESGNRVLIDTPDTASHDALKDLILDTCLAGGDVEALMDEFYQDRFEERVLTALRKFQAFYRSSRNVELTADLMDWVSGASSYQDIALGDYCKKHGITKQAFTQAADSIREGLNLRSQSKRDDEACKKMVMRTTRRTKPKFKKSGSDVRDTIFSSKSKGALHA